MIRVLLTLVRLTFIIGHNMKNFLAVVKHENKKITKYQDFDTQAEADVHVAKYDGFVVAAPNTGNMEFWEVDGTSLTHNSSTQDAETIKRNAMKEIHRLESEITPRRLRDAYSDPTWINAQEAKIATEREKL